MSKPEAKVPNRHLLEELYFQRLNEDLEKRLRADSLPAPPGKLIAFRPRREKEIGDKEVKAA